MRDRACHMHDGGQETRTRHLRLAVECDGLAQRVRKLPVLGQRPACQHVVDTQHGALRLEQIAIDALAFAQDGVVLLGITRHQHQATDAVQQAGRERHVRIEVHVPRQHPRAGGGGDRQAPEGLVIERRAAAAGKAAGDRCRHDQVARGLHAQERQCLLDRRDLDLQAEGRRIGQAQCLGSQRLIKRHLFCQQGQIGIFLVDTAQQLHHDSRQRGQVVQAGRQFIEGHGATCRSSR